ncbi:MAG: DUF3597 domain-containing protein [Frankiaceae bacterium]|nr:DUF3597 domain-containing protein [Arenimonas sp.]
MGIFSSILEKLGIGTAHAKPAPDIRPYGPKAGMPGAATAGMPAGNPAAAPVAISDVDVVAQLEKRAAASSEKLNWRTSIVDLLKLLDIDSGLSDRKELATELGCPADKMSDSASMNIWLHKEVLKRIAANGGNVPANLLD